MLAFCNLLFDFHVFLVDGSEPRYWIIRVRMMKFLQFRVFYLQKNDVFDFLDASYSRGCTFSDDLRQNHISHRVSIS